MFILYVLINNLKNVFSVVKPFFQKTFGKSVEEMALSNKSSFFRSLVDAIVSNATFLNTLQSFRASTAFLMFTFNQRKWTKILQKAIKDKKKCRGQNHTIRIARRELLLADVDFQGARNYYTRTNQLRLSNRRSYKPSQVRK
jgi:hypothetical protein